MQHGPTRDIDNRGWKGRRPQMRNRKGVFSRMIIVDRHRIIAANIEHAKIILPCATRHHITFIPRQLVIAITAVKF